jgi:hypothetical protein
VAPKYAGQGMATEAANAAIRYAFGHLGAKAISIGYFDGNKATHGVEAIGGRFSSMQLLPWTSECAVTQEWTAS